MKNIIQKSQEKSLTYQAYRELVKSKFEEGKSTSEEDSQALVDYTKLNLSRMKRLDKTTIIPEEITTLVKAIDKKVEWVVLTEGWCGDAAQNLPVINKIAELNSNIDLKIVLRDENPELMNEFLTNGGKAIPKLIQIENDEVTKSWGPRPTIATQMVKDFKEANGSVTAEFKKDLQVWYNKNKNENVIKDILALLN